MDTGLQAAHRYDARGLATARQECRRAPIHAGCSATNFRAALPADSRSARLPFRPVALVAVSAVALAPPDCLIGMAPPHRMRSAERVPWLTCVKAASTRSIHDESRVGQFPKLRSLKAEHVLRIFRNRGK